PSKNQSPGDAVRRRCRICRRTMQNHGASERCIFANAGSTSPHDRRVPCARIFRTHRRGIGNMRDAAEVVKDIKARVSMLDVATRFMRMKHMGGEKWKSECPFHQEKTPSFVVNHDKDFFHCFGCGESGDQIGFVMKIQGTDFLDAVSWLADEFGIAGLHGLPPVIPKPTPPPRKRLSAEEREAKEKKERQETARRIQEIL